MKSRFIEAAKEDYNIIGLCGAVSLSLVTLNPLPLLAGMVGEAIYLAFVPDSLWYKKRFQKRESASSEKERTKFREQIFPNLRSEMKNRYNRLVNVREDISSQSANGSDEWVNEIVQKLEYLLDKFLQFAQKEQQFRDYLWDVRKEVEDEIPAQERRLIENSEKSGDRWVEPVSKALEKRYDAEIEAITKQLESGASDISILERRKSVLLRRKDFGTKTFGILRNLNNQLALLEDTFGLISDELLARPPEQILHDIDDVVISTNAMSDVLNEMARHENHLTRTTSGLLA